MNDQPYIKQSVVYGHADDPKFFTSCRDHALAYQKVYPNIPELKRRLEASGRFSTESHLNGALARDVALLVDWELAKIQGKEEWSLDGLAHKTPPKVRKTPIYDGMDATE